MDFSETYIKMCQHLDWVRNHKLMEGDYYYWDNWEENHPLLEGCVRLGVDYENWSGRVPISGGRYIWLPRQDQLQEMIKSGSGSPIWMIRTLDVKIQKWYDSGDNQWVKISSMEQLWLAFVMKEKYNKIWNGEEWVK